MATKLYVGGLTYTATDDQLRELFSTIGTVESAQIIVDRFSNKSKGFGFVEMGSEEEAQAAIKELNGKDYEGRPLMVSPARPRTDSPNHTSNSSRKFNNKRRPRY